MIYVMCYSRYRNLNYAADNSCSILYVAVGTDTLEIQLVTVAVCDDKLNDMVLQMISNGVKQGVVISPIFSFVDKNTPSELLNSDCIY